jgi:NADH:ubiquinone oxidoreductase subunit B-like Fe-S oxidoreductase
MHHRMAPVLKRVDDQMCEHTWVVAFGACAASGGFSRRDATMQAIDRGIPVDVSMAGCPPRPKAVLEGLIRSQQKVDTADRLDRRTLLRVDGWVYAARRLVHVTSPVNAEAAPVVGAHEPQALHPWQGMDTDQDHSLVLRTDICSVA